MSAHAYLFLFWLSLNVHILHTIQFKGVHGPYNLVFPDLSTVPTYFIEKKNVQNSTIGVKLLFWGGGVKLLFFNHNSFL